MKAIHKNWTIKELIKNIDQIEFPEFQREPNLWKLDKKQRLIDSILRGFDISSIYLHKKEAGFDCIDGQQRINAIRSYLGRNDGDKDDNGFHLRIDNEIYNDEGKFDYVNNKRYSTLESTNEGTVWVDKILDYKLNIVEVTEVENDEELNLLFLRLQIATVLNGGEKLKAMKGDIRNVIFFDIAGHDFFKKIKIPSRRYAREQVATQIALNEFSKRDNNAFHKSRYVDMQQFFKDYDRLEPKDNETVKTIKNNLDKIVHYFDGKLKYITNRAISVSLYLFMSQLIEENRENEIQQFVNFFDLFLKTMKWQLPLGVQMNSAYYDLLKFSSYVTQAADEKSAIEKRHDFLSEYFFYYNQKGKIKGDDEYFKNTKIKADAEREKIKL